MEKKQIEKAIPGGKYGTALLLKHFYPHSFIEVSLGKMVAMVKKSLEDVKYVHHKTLIYPNEYDQPKKDSEAEEEIKSNINKLVEKQRQEGVALSQLPSLYQESFGQKLNFEEMGYSKLKSLLQTISEIEVLKNSKNHLKVVSKKFSSQAHLSNHSSRKQSFNDSWKEKGQKPN